MSAFVTTAALCVCGHLESSHNIGTRAGVKVRTACSNASGDPVTPCACRLFVPRRPVTPDKKTDTGTRIKVKRACNGCDGTVGDVTEAEIDRAMAGLPLLDVRRECPSCWREAAE